MGDLDLNSCLRMAERMAGMGSNSDRNHKPEYLSTHHNDYTLLGLWTRLEKSSKKESWREATSP